MSALSFESELSIALKKLRSIPRAVRREDRKKILSKAAQILVKAARANIKDSSKPHIRYSGGKRIATYYPGNLRKSIRILRGSQFRKSPDVFVGPKVSKRGTGQGEFGRGSRTDGYYAHFVEFGTPFQPGQAYMRKAYEATRFAVVRQVEQLIARKINNHIKKIAI